MHSGALIRLSHPSFERLQFRVLVNSMERSVYDNFYHFGEIGSLALKMLVLFAILLFSYRRFPGVNNWISIEGFAYFKNILAIV